MSRHRRTHYSIHHVIPRSRCAEMGVDPNREANLVELDSHLHTLYHELFSNRTPAEIIDYLNTHFWNGFWTGQWPK